MRPEVLVGVLMERSLEQLDKFIVRPIVEYFQNQPEKTWWCDDRP